MSTTTKVAGATGVYLDDRVGVAKLAKKNLKKVFPDHWSFMLGEIALYSFIILLISGTFLTLWYKPSMAEVVYDGPYVPLRGLPMSEAYESTLALSFEVRGGLMMRQVHHWAALLFVAATAVHMFRVFFTGAFRKPRELNWVIGVVLVVLGLGAGFTGYSLPDDLLSGTGLAIINGILHSIPLIGSYAAFFVFGGPYPGEDIISRLYIAHVLIIPGLLVAVITVHMALLVFHKHTQYPGPGRKETNVVGYPLLPVYMAKAGGFFFLVFGVIALISAVATINAIWSYGPYKPTQITAGTQPDWYIGWLDGGLRLMPGQGTEFAIAGYTVSLNVLIPSVIIPGLLFTVLAIYPFIEQWVTGDRREHHLLDRPRNQPVRTGLGVMAITFYVILWAAGGSDIIAITFGMSSMAILWTFRIALFIAPYLAYVITKRICLALQRRDRDLVLHGRESGRIQQLPHGEFVEVHEPITEDERWTLTQHTVYRPLELGAAVDDNGVRRPGTAVEKVRARISRFYFGDRIEPPTPQEVRQLEASGEHH